METQPGMVNWAPVNNMLAPGETRALAWQAVGHGADAVLYWQWRPALNGQEQYHGSVVGPDGAPEAIYPELAQLGQDFALTQGALSGTSPQAEIAMLYDYDSRWAIEFQPQTVDYDQQQILLRYYAPVEHAAELAGEAVDVVDPMRGPLDAYRLLIAPSLNVMDKALAKKLAAWVYAGGHLVLGPRSGMKDEYDALQPERQPGPLEVVLGARVEQFYALDKSVGLRETGSSGSTGTGAIWAESLMPNEPGVKVNMVYVDPGGWLDNKAAMVTRSYGKGTIAYVGTVPDAEMMKRLLGTYGVLPPAIADDVAGGEIELCTRERMTATGLQRVYIAINHSEKQNTLVMHMRVHSLLPGAQVEMSDSGSGEVSTVKLQPQGVAILVPLGKVTASRKAF